MRNLSPAVRTKPPPRRMSPARPVASSKNTYPKGSVEFKIKDAKNLRRTEIEKKKKVYIT